MKLFSRLVISPKYEYLFLSKSLQTYRSCDFFILALIPEDQAKTSLEPDFKTHFDTSMQKGHN